MSNKPIKKGDRNSPWYKRNISDKAYNINSVALINSFLIICEGANTEPKYFESFPVPSNLVKTVGLGMSKTALVKKAIKISKEEENKGRKVWCVFDFDIKRDQNGQQADYNNAIQLAKSKGFEVAYSNDSFELWFILHYQFVDSQLTRKEYYEILNTHWQIDDYEEYGKSLSFCMSIYNNLQNDSKASQSKAIERAKLLYETYRNLTYSNQNPCTTVFRLVEELNATIR